MKPTHSCRHDEGCAAATSSQYGRNTSVQNATSCLMASWNSSFLASCSSYLPSSSCLSGLAAHCRSGLARRHLAASALRQLRGPPQLKLFQQCSVFLVCLGCTQYFFEPLCRQLLIRSPIHVYPWICEWRSAHANQCPVAHIWVPIKHLNARKGTAQDIISGCNSST